MNEVVYYNELFDIYGFLLTKKQQDIFILYYFDNLSLSEIADIQNVSRSYVSKIIDNTKKKLDYYEANINHLELLKKSGNN